MSTLPPGAHFCVVGGPLGSLLADVATLAPGALALVVTVDGYPVAAERMSNLAAVGHQAERLAVEVWARWRAAHPSPEQVSP
jgi:hypothetical protein